MTVLQPSAIPGDAQGIASYLYGDFMPQWQRTLKIGSHWKDAQAGKISHHQLATVLGALLKAMEPLNDEGLDEARQDLAGAFEDLAADKGATVSDFDDLMHDLYDWADTKLDDKWNGKAVCWVDAFGLTTKTER